MSGHQLRLVDDPSAPPRSTGDALFRLIFSALCFLDVVQHQARVDNEVRSVEIERGDECVLEKREIVMINLGVPKRSNLFLPTDELALLVGEEIQGCSQA